MKLQTGLLYRDMRLARPRDLDALLTSSNDPKPGDGGRVVDGALAMAYAGDRITPQEEEEVQPVSWQHLRLTFDGRLDNREDVARRLSLTNIADIPDSLLIMKGYETFGNSIFSDFVGDFALTLWSSQSRRLSFCRSLSGIRPLYYVFNKHMLMWSTDFNQLVRTSKVDFSINENYVLEYLTAHPSSRHTAFTHVNVVPNGTLLHFENNRFHEPVNLWNPTRIRKLQYRFDNDYEEQCRELVSEAVRVRLRAAHPVFAELSGGLDSSTIILTADHVLTSSNSSPTKLRTVSCVYDESDTCDEQFFIRLVEEKRGIKSAYIHEADQEMTFGLSETNFTGLPSHLDCCPGTYRLIQRIMRECGAHILMTGSGGDHLFWSIRDGAPLIADHLVNREFLRAHQQTRTWSRFTGVPYWKLLAKDAATLAIRSARGKAPEYLSSPVPGWLTPRCRKSLSAQLAQSSKPIPGMPPSFAIHLRMVTSLFSQTSAGYHGAYPDIHITHPYTHRPLVEFCLAVPISQFLRQGQMRSLMRRSFNQLLPPKIAARRSKGSIDEAYIRALHRDWNHIGDVRSWHLCKRGIADAAQIHARLEQLRLGIQPTDFSTRAVFSMERWLRSLDHINYVQHGQQSHASVLM